MDNQTTDGLSISKEWMKDILSRNGEDFSQITTGNLRSVMTTTIQQVLDAFGKGDSEKLLYFASEIRNAIYANTGITNVIDTLHTQQFLAIKMLGILQMVESYLNHPNISSSLAAIVNKKISGCRNIFMRMVKEDRKYTHSELQTFASQNEPETNGSINNLLALGLIRNENPDGRNLLYELTHHGRIMKMFLESTL